jgi:hypothetical protein
MLRAAIVALGLLGTSGCKASSNAPPSPSAHAGASATPLAALAASVSKIAAESRRQASDVVMPPATAPDDADHGPGGVRWKVLRTGGGGGIGEHDTVRADFSVWTQTGTLAFTSYKDSGPAGFSAMSVPHSFFALLSRFSPGSKVWFWLPAPFVHAVAQEHVRFPYPDTALILEYEPVAIDHLASSAPASSSAAAAPAPTPASQFPEPDAGGPPKGALATSHGLRYVFLAQGGGPAKPVPDQRLDLRLTLWPVTGLVVGPPVLSNQLSATTLARAPAGLGSILQSMTEGSVVRVWLPPGKARAVAPIAADGEAVLDLGLEKIE